VPNSVPNQAPEMGTIGHFWYGAFSGQGAHATE
jgi:hypothetical protein